MKNWIRNWLGINGLKSAQSITLSSIGDVHRKLATLDGRIAATNAGLGRVIAHLDPMYAKDELDPERRKESEKIGEAVEKKLLAEDWARKHTAGEENG